MAAVRWRRRTAVRQSARDGGLLLLLLLLRLRLLHQATAICFVRRGEARRTMSSAWIQQIRSEKASHIPTAGSSGPLVFTAFSCWVRSGSGGTWIFRVMFGMQTCSCATGTGPWHEEWVCGLLVLPWLPSPFRVSVGKSAASSRHRRLRRIRVGEGISGSRQGGRSRAHSAALNVSGGWIKMDFLDLREQRSADSQNRTAFGLPRKTSSDRLLAQLTFETLHHGWLVAEPIMSAFEGFLESPCHRRRPGCTSSTSSTAIPSPRDRLSRDGKRGCTRLRCRRKKSSQLPRWNGNVVGP
jgi:hypothetical protein